MPYTETTQRQLTINKIPKSVYDTITPNEHELYFVDDNIIYETQDHKTTVINSSSTDFEYPSAKAVNDAIIDAVSGLPTPMQFKGTVGTSGTIEWSALPTASSSTGFTYKVITDHVTAPICQVGDTIISNGTEWIVVPSGDEPSGTVTSVVISNGGGLSVSGSPITSSGIITISHADTSSQSSVSNTGRTYIQGITLDTYGHVTGLSSATETVTDTNTTYTLNVSGTGENATKVGLVAGGSGSGTNWYTIPYATTAGSANSVAWANISGHDAGVDADLGINTSSGDTTKFLNAKGGWAVPAGTYVHPAYDTATAAAVKIGRDSTGHVIIGAALTAADIGADTWGKSASGGLYYPTATQTIDVQESTVLITGIGATNLLKDNSDDADAALVLIGDNNVPLASASAAGATTYNMLAALNCVRDYPELYSKLSALYTNIYLKADNNQDPVGKSPTSVLVASDGTFTLTLASTVNPVSSVTSLKFGNGVGSSHTALTLGNGIYNNGMNSLVVGMCSYNTGAYSLVAGQAVYNDGGTGAVIMGARSYNSARYSLLAGDSHKNVKLGAALLGVGHDSTNGPEGIAAVGKYSLITSTTAFAVGNGTSVSARSNAFEVLTDGSVKAKGTITVNDTAVSLDGHTHTYTLNGASTTSLSFYAPTSAGTSGYVLQSNGSGAPSWVTPPSGLPDVTSSDNNKVLTVVNGAWAASASATATMIFREWTA